jgi:hypothetical protein
VKSFEAMAARDIAALLTLYSLLLGILHGKFVKELGIL